MQKLYIVHHQFTQIFRCLNIKHKPFLRQAGFKGGLNVKQEELKAKALEVRNKERMEAEHNERQNDTSMNWSRTFGGKNGRIE